MRVLGAFVGAAAFLAAAAPSWAATLYQATLTGTQETPPVATNALGTAIFTLNDAQDRLDYTIYTNGIDLTGSETPQAGDNMIMAHFHQAPPGTPGPIVFDIYMPPSDSDPDLVINPANNSLTGVWNASEGLTGEIAALNAGLLYVNIHTAAHPSGEIRGQVLPLNPVPVPGSIGLLVSGLAGLAGYGWRARAKRV